MTRFWSSETNPTSGPPSDAQSGARILVVDDEEGVRSVLRGTLERVGYEVLEAEDGVAALERLREVPVSLILSDLLMPRMGGLDLLRAAKRLDDTVGFILLTAAGTLRNAVDALRGHADDYLLKPFDIEEVRLAVYRSLEHRRVLLENRRYQRNLEARVAEQTAELEQLFVDALLAMASAVEARDGYTGGHIERVTRYAVATGRVMALGPARLRNLWVGGLLHDVGKIGIPDEILRKPGKLSASEHAIMVRHPLIGASILERSHFLRAALPGVLHHHERWDGGGYPHGLSGEAIPVEGRVLAVADTYDAIVTDRPYRPARSLEEGLAELRLCAGTQFDPAVVEAFAVALKRGFPEDPDMPLIPGLGGRRRE